MKQILFILIFGAFIFSCSPPAEVITVENNLPGPTDLPGEAVASNSERTPQNTIDMTVPKNAPDVTPKKKK